MYPFAEFFLNYIISNDYNLEDFCSNISPLNWKYCIYQTKFSPFFDTCDQISDEVNYKMHKVLFFSSKTWRFQKP